jgi:hypothetical protein
MKSHFLSLSLFLVCVCVFIFFLFEVLDERVRGASDGLRIARLREIDFSTASRRMRAAAALPAGC